MKDQLSTYQGGKCLPRAMMNDLINSSRSDPSIPKKKKKASIFPLLHSMEKLSEVYINNTLNLEISQSRLKKKQEIYILEAIFFTPDAYKAVSIKMTVS